MSGGAILGDGNIALILDPALAVAAPPRFSSMPESHPTVIAEVCTAPSEAAVFACPVTAVYPGLQSETRSTERSAGSFRVDPALASSTFRLANSAYFAAQAERSGIRRAGDSCVSASQEIYRLAALSSVAGRWMNRNRGYQWEPGDFCRHVTVLMPWPPKYLAEKTDQVDPKPAYTAGLVHEIGKLAITHACAKFFPLIRACQQQRGYRWEQAEKDVLGYEHAEVGARLLRAWHFPELMIAAAEYQHRPTQAPLPAIPLLAHLHAGRYIAASMGPGISEDGFLFEVNGDLLAEWNFTSAVLEEAMLISVERASKRLAENLTHGAIQF